MIFYLSLDWKFSSELENNFCFLFQIQSLSSVIQFESHVVNEKLSIDLFHFYSHSMELIQNFLLNKSFITDEQSKYFSSVFARLHLVCVDQIELLYNYQGETLRKEFCDTYLDEQAGRFYILKQFERCQARYNECMAKYLVQDRRVLAELIAFMMELSRIYENEGQQGLIQRRDSIEHQYKWTLPNVYFTQSVLPSSTEEISLIEEVGNVSSEMVEQVMNEAIPERKPPSRITTDKDIENNPTCFPAKANTIQSQSTDSAYISNSNQSSSASISSNSSFSSRKNNKPEESRRNGTSADETTFKHIRISTLTDSNLYRLSSTSITINPNDHVVDESTGRVGEEFVYRFLQWKYPDESVKWMNEKKESGLPYDIQIRTKNNSIEFIEVKTTRIQGQHTFQISIGEVECLLKNPSTYHIYRVYYSDDVQMSEISILSQVKNHLDQKQLALCMTILQRSDQQLQ